MNDETKEYREAFSGKTCGLTVAQMKRAMEAAFREQDRLDAVPAEFTACACMGPMPHCQCEQGRMRRILAAAFAAALEHDETVEVSPTVINRPEVAVVRWSDQAGRDPGYGTGVEPEWPDASGKPVDVPPALRTPPR